MLAIRMRRVGAKKRPFFRVVVTERRTPRDGAFEEILGHYYPRTKPAKIEIDRGVVFECLVGAHNNAKDLTTGIVRFAPGAQLAYHKHTFTESVTLLEGSAVMDIEGRRYVISPMDNVVIPPGLATRSASSPGECGEAAASSDAPSTVANASRCACPSSSPSAVAPDASASMKR